MGCFHSLPLVHLFFQLRPALTAGQREQVAITGWCPMSRLSTRTNGHVTQTSSSLGPCPSHSQARSGEDSEEPFGLERRSWCYRRVQAQLRGVFTAVCE